MYSAHFGLSELPFTLSPNTRFFLNMPSHQEALNLMLVALHSGDGFIKVVGEVGTGKTLLCRKLLNTLDADDYVTLYLPNSYLSPDEFRHGVAHELGVDGEKSTQDLLQDITHNLIAHARAGRRVVLLVDEAQAMPIDTLEALRLLTNLETESQKLFQVVLFGQPELETVLDQYQLRQLKQRITYSYTLRTLTSDEVRHYIQRRLAAAGHAGATLFDHRASRLIAEASAGVPRLVNVLSHKALMVAYGKGDYRVRADYARSAIEDTDGARPPEETQAKTWWSVAAAAALGGLVTWGMIATGVIR